jgi:hypothetical protein
MSDDFEPFFSSSEADSISEQYPDLQSLDVEIEMSKIAGEDVGYRRYDESDLPSHIQCPECGERVSVGWTVADHIDEKETDFEETESCHGQIYEGKTWDTFMCHSHPWGQKTRSYRSDPLLLTTAS